MKIRAQNVNFRGVVEYGHEAEAHLQAAGQAVLVRRGVDRSLTMACPDGCGETLTVNLDSRSGPAWRLYRDEEVVSLFPSVWRKTGCRSHFIVWRSHIYWCDWHEELQPVDAKFEATVLSVLAVDLRPYEEVAQELEAVPWAVLSACRQLRRRGLAAEGSANRLGWFRRYSDL